MRPLLRPLGSSPRLDVIRTKAPCGCTERSGRGTAKRAGPGYAIGSYPQGPLFPLSVSLDLLHSTEMIAVTKTFYGLPGLSAKWYEKPRNPANGQEPKQFLIHSEPLKWTRHLCLLKKRKTPIDGPRQLVASCLQFFLSCLATSPFWERPRKGKWFSHWEQGTPSFFLNYGSIQNQLSFEHYMAKTIATEWSFNSLSLSFWWQTLTADYNRTTCNVLVIKKVTVTKHFKLWIASD